MSARGLSTAATAVWLLGLLVAVASFLALELLPVPYAWIGALWLGFCIVLMLGSSRRWTRLLALTVAVLSFGLAGAECYLFLKYRRPELRDQAFDRAGQRVARSRPHPTLGWSPIPGTNFRWKRTRGDRTVFDVRHRIGKNGLRVSAPPATNVAERCVLFFGGSFTFGAGVEDEETVPYRVASLSRGRIRTYNFGYSGYGAQQMLIAVRQGLVLGLVRCAPTDVIYQATPGHVRLASRPGSWATGGPRFELGEEGGVVYRGQFDEATRPEPGRLGSWAEKSLIVRTLENRITAEEMDLYVAIVRSSRDEFERRYSGAEFRVLLWDEPNRLSKELADRLGAEGIRLHLMSDVLPGYGKRSSLYVLDRYDSLPNPAAHARIASWIAEQLLSEIRPIAREAEKMEHSVGNQGK